MKYDLKYVYMYMRVCVVWSNY